MRVHLPSLPHTETTREWEHCAYTQKWLRLPGMLQAHGHETILYASERDESEATEHVVVVTAEDRRRWFGGETYRDRVFDQWTPGHPAWVEMNHRVIGEMRARIGPTDIVGITMGCCQQAIADAFPNHVICEVGCGYEGILARSHVAFESNAWRHHVYGLRGIHDGRHFDDCIPNSFPPDEFVTATDDGYLLFLGRMIPRKGLDTVRELAKRFRVITAGQGGPQVDGAEHVGVVYGAEKRELLAHATALISPTAYVEPFGGVTVEAMLSGVPVLTTNFGAYVETVEQGITGFRCNTLAEFVAACEDAPSLDREWIAARAKARFSTDAVAPQYDAWLRRCATLYGDGWYQDVEVAHAH